jgi:hypothetical protein
MRSMTSAGIVAAVHQQVVFPAVIPHWFGAPQSGQMSVFT